MMSVICFKITPKVKETDGCGRGGTGHGLKVTLFEFPKKKRK